MATDQPPVYTDCADAERVLSQGYTYITIEEASQQTRNIAETKRRHLKILLDFYQEQSLYHEDLDSLAKYFNLPVILKLPTTDRSALISNWFELLELSHCVLRTFQRYFSSFGIYGNPPMSKIIQCTVEILREFSALFNNQKARHIFLFYAANRPNQLEKYIQLLNRTSSIITSASQNVVMPYSHAKTDTQFQDILNSPEENLHNMSAKLGDLAAEAPDEVMSPLINVNEAIGKLESRIKKQLLIRPVDLSILESVLVFDPSLPRVPQIAVPNRFLEQPVTKLVFIHRQPEKLNHPFDEFVNPAEGELVNFYLFNDLLIITDTQNPSKLKVLACARRSDVEVLHTEAADEAIVLTAVHLSIRTGNKTILLLLKAASEEESLRLRSALLIYDNSVAEAPPPLPPRTTSRASAVSRDEVDMGRIDKPERDALEAVLAITCLFEIDDLRVRSPAQPCWKLLSQTSKFQNNDMWNRLSKDDRNLQELMFEILVTEVTYFHNLHLLYWRLFNRLEFIDTLSPGDYKSVVSHMPEIYKMSKLLLHSLAFHWQNECKCLLLDSGFLRVLRNFVVSPQFEKIYTMTISEQAEQAGHFDKLMHEGQQATRPKTVDVVQNQSGTNAWMFRLAVQKFEESFGPMKVSVRDFLIMPFNRVTKLDLLLKEIASKSTSNQDQFNLANEIHLKLKTLLLESNERKRTMENCARYIKFAEDLDETQPIAPTDLSIFQPYVKRVLFHHLFTWVKTEKSELPKSEKGRELEKILKNGPLICVELYLFDNYVILACRKRNSKLTIVERCSLDQVECRAVDSTVDLQIEQLRKLVSKGTTNRKLTRQTSSDITEILNFDTAYINTASSLTIKLEIGNTGYLLQAPNEAVCSDWMSLFQDSKRRKSQI